MGRTTIEIRDHENHFCMEHMGEKKIQLRDWERRFGDKSDGFNQNAN